MYQPLSQVLHGENKVHMDLSLPLEPVHQTQSSGRLVVEILGYGGWVLTIIPVHILNEIKQCLHITYLMQPPCTYTTSTTQWKTAICTSYYTLVMACCIYLTSLLQITLVCGRRLNNSCQCQDNRHYKLEVVTLCHIIYNLGKHIYQGAGCGIHRVFASFPGHLR